MADSLGAVFEILILAAVILWVISACIYWLNQISERIYYALKKMYEEIGAIDETLNSILVINAGTAAEEEEPETDDLGLCSPEGKYIQE